jgi:hypothetical protein
MLIRGCVLLCVLCGLVSAGSTQDYFSRAFGNGFPSPFFKTPFPDSGPKFWSQGPIPPQMGNLPQQGSLVVPNKCAIPLIEMKIPNDYQFSMRKFRAGDGSRADALAKPAMPVCKR